MLLSITKELTAENFIEFVEAQDPDRPIKHNAGWCGCAAGEYLSFAKDSPASSGDVLDFIYRFEHDHSQYNRLWEALGEDKFNVKLPTYGDLQKFIKNDFQFEE